MKKLGTISTLIVLLSFTAGVYGMLHNQITYSISPEYFTKFKYLQFGINDQNMGSHRGAVAVIGFFASWWVGAIIGATMGILTLSFSDRAQLKRLVRKAILLLFLIAIVFGMAGYFIGSQKAKSPYTDFLLPTGVIDPASFLKAAYVHDFSYLGGAVGLAVVIVFMLAKGRKWV